MKDFLNGTAWISFAFGTFGLFAQGALALLSDQDHSQFFILPGVMLICSVAIRQIKQEYYGNR